MQKTCSKCNTEKPVDSFYKRSDTGGFRNDCKDCCNKRSTTYHQDNPEKAKAKCLKHYYKNKAQYRAATRRYTATKRAQMCTCCTKEQFVLLYEGTPKDCEVDHIIPLSKGGMHCLKNLQYLTRFENRSKGAKYEVDAIGGSTNPS